MEFKSLLILDGLQWSLMQIGDRVKSKLNCGQIFPARSINSFKLAYRYQQINLFHMHRFNTIIFCNLTDEPMILFGNIIKVFYLQYFISESGKPFCHEEQLDIAASCKKHPFYPS
jgi:hypothetical protein